jgi:hypothetical protein
MNDLAEVESADLRKVGWRLIPFLWLMYLSAFLDRTSVSFAALQMSRDLRFSASVYGLGNLGGFVGPYVIGVLKDATGGFTSGLRVAAAGVLSTGILTILLSPRPASRDATGMNR